jgi:hypothetical protein
MDCTTRVQIQHSIKSVLITEANVSKASITVRLLHCVCFTPSKAILTTQSAVTLTCDVVITAALTHVLKGTQGGIEVLVVVPSLVLTTNITNSCSQSTRSIITTLIINAVSRGVLTALCAAVNMILVCCLQFLRFELD